MSIALEAIREITPEMIKKVPSPFLDPVEEAHESYTLFYKLHEDDSPRESRSSLVRRLVPIFENLQPGDKVLDIGAGRGIFESEFGNQLLDSAAKNSNELDSNLEKNPISIVTVDIADLNKDQLFTADNPNILHVQASGTQLPFANDTFASGFSNLAIDFMPKNTLIEFRRVIQEGARVSLNLHHPDTITPPGVENALSQLQRKISQGKKYNKKPNIKDYMSLIALRHKSYLKENKILFENTEQIEQTFANAGFEISEIKLAGSVYDKWWEVDMINGPKRISERGLSLSQRLAEDLPSIEANSTIAAFGISKTDLNHVQNQNFFEANHVTLVHSGHDGTKLPFEDKKVSVVIGNISANTLSQSLTEIERVTESGGAIHLNVNTQEGPSESEYYNPELDEILKDHRDIYLRGTTKRSSGGQTWWELDATIYPDRDNLEEMWRGSKGICRTGSTWEELSLYRDEDY